ncbi:LVIVD repeat-containing protein [Chitinophaga lutea]
MRKLILCVPILLAALMLGGCDKENCSRTVSYKIYTPIWKSVADYQAEALLPAQTLAPQEIGRSGNIYIKDKYLFVNEPGKGIHVIDNTNPAAPQKISFLKIDGNRQMAILGNLLYANRFSDLNVYDISDPRNIRSVKAIPFALGYTTSREGMPIGLLFGANRDSIVVGYTSRDTSVVVSCNPRTEPIMFDAAANFSEAAKAAMGTGKGGSMAMFTILKNHLYTIDAYRLTTFDLADPANPQMKNTVPVGPIETIFPYGDNLFIGGNNAMYIYNLADPAKPERKSVATHFRACDPVVVEGTTAYVTIRSGVTCGGSVNQLLVYDVADIFLPKLLGTYDMLSPHGLGVDNKRLFVCEDNNGLRLLDAKDPKHVVAKSQIKDIQPIDVIPFDGQDRLLVTAKDGIYQYSYANMASPVKISRIAVLNKDSQ